MQFKRLASAAALAVAAISSVASAGTIKIFTDPAAPYNGVDGTGGAFTVKSTGGFNGILGGLGAAADSFYTFCIERNENINNNGTYQTAITNGAINGGLGGQTSPGYDPISEGTALLYSMFRAGADFGGGFGIINTAEETTALQYAIWQLEGEGSLTWNSANPTQNAAVNGAKANFLAVAATAVTGNFYGVAVLNLYSNGVNSQDQLTLVPTPQAAGAGLSLLAGLGIVGYIKRRRNSIELD